VNALRASELDPHPMVVHVAPMRRRHLRGVLRIEAQNNRKGWSLGLFMSELSQTEARIYLVATVDGMVVGYAGALFAGSDAHVTTVSVDPAWQGRGIGTRLMLVLARRAVGREAEALTLEVRASNRAAMGLYRRFGFAPAGVRKKYYTDTGEDAVVMWATDADQPDYAARLDAIEAALPRATIVDEVGW
jgi:[ribosomal protein S18]-alanine N-acetyltransferase